MTARFDRWITMRSSLGRHAGIRGRRKRESRIVGESANGFKYMPPTSLVGADSLNKIDDLIFSRLISDLSSYDRESLSIASIAGDEKRFFQWTQYGSAGLFRMLTTTVLPRSVLFSRLMPRSWGGGRTVLATVGRSDFRSRKQKCTPRGAFLKRTSGAGSRNRTGTPCGAGF